MSWIVSLIRCLLVGFFLLSLLLSAIIHRRLFEPLMMGTAESGALWRARCARWHLQLIGRLAGLKIVVEGSMPGPNDRFLLLANHVSYWDVVAIGSLFPLGFLAKEEVRAWILLGSLATAINTIFVKRESVESRLRALRELKLKTSHLSYCVFPEGTTTRAAAPHISNWYRGQISLARKPGRKVYILGLHYSDQEELAWVGDDAFLPHLFRVLRRPTIEIFLSIRPFEDELQESHELKHLVKSSFRQIVEASLVAEKGARTPKYMLM